MIPKCCYRSMYFRNDYGVWECAKCAHWVEPYDNIEFAREAEGWTDILARLIGPS